jgi:hypothetical protein
MIMERIKDAEAGFRSLSEAIDTTTAPGRMMMQMVGAFAEFERAILRERTKAGLIPPVSGAESVSAVDSKPASGGRIKTSHFFPLNR